jgi:hypothetical protein
MKRMHGIARLARLGVALALLQGCKIQTDGSPWKSTGGIPPVWIESPSPTPTPSVSNEGRPPSVLSIPSPAAGGKTFVVSPTGNDSADGETAPWRTLQHACNSVRAGDVVVVRPGRYVGMSCAPLGTEDRPIVFHAETGAIIDTRNVFTEDGINLEGGAYVTIEGFEVIGTDRAGIRSVTNHHITIRNNKSDGNYMWGIFSSYSDYIRIENNETSRSLVEHGIYVSHSTMRPVIRYNISWGNKTNGIHLNSGHSPELVDGALVENNVIYGNGENGGSAINCDGIQNAVIRNNLAYGNHWSGLSLYHYTSDVDATNNLVVNNTIVAGGYYGMNLKDPGNTFYNNIFDSVSMRPEARVGYHADYNIITSQYISLDGGNLTVPLAQWQSTTGQDQHSRNLAASLLFLDVAARNFRLLVPGPAAGAGTIFQTPPVNVEGSPRRTDGLVDIGAY